MTQRSRRGLALRVALGLLAGSVILPACATAQANGEAGSHTSALEREYPQLNAMLLRLERAQGVLFGERFDEGNTVRAKGDSLPTFEFEFGMIERLTAITTGDGTAADVAADAAEGYAVLGARGAEVIARGNDFYRELLGIYADPSITDRRSAVDQAVDRYLSRPETALPAQPKNMDILYDHPNAWAFRTGYADLGGFVWAGHWFQLAVTEPMMSFPARDERLVGFDTITARYESKLSYGEPPAFFPSELPLTQPIVPFLTGQHQRAAIIIDNLNMLQDVLADILVSPDVEDVRAALDEAIDQFVDPQYRITTTINWMSMALRHSIFQQGGPPLGVMLRDERNQSGHAQHLGGGGSIGAGMPG